MAKINVRQIVVEYLKEHGFDGLQDSQCECGCETNDLMPCYSLWSGSGNVPACQPGYRTACDCGDHDWHMSPTREENPAAACMQVVNDEFRESVRRVTRPDTGRGQETAKAMYTLYEMLERHCE